MITTKRRMAALEPTPVNELPRNVGRPRRSTEVADRNLTIRITASEYQRWAAKAGNRPLGPWIRDLLNAVK